MNDRDREAYESRTISVMLWPMKTAQTTGALISKPSKKNASMGLSGRGGEAHKTATQIENANTIPDHGQAAMPRRVTRIKTQQQVPWQQVPWQQQSLSVVASCVGGCII